MCQSVNRKALDLGLFSASFRASTSIFPGLDWIRRVEFCWVQNGTRCYPKQKMINALCWCRPCCYLLRILIFHAGCLIDSYKLEWLEWERCLWLLSRICQSYLLIPTVFVSRVGICRQHTKIPSRSSSLWLRHLIPQHTQLRLAVHL